MSVPGSRTAVDIDLEEFEKRLRMAGTPAAGVEDPLAELARLVEASRPKAADAAAAPVVARAVASAAGAPPVASAPPIAAPPVVAGPRVVAAPPPPEAESAPELEAEALRPASDDGADQAPEAPEVVAAVEAPQELASEPYPENLFAEPAADEPRRSRRWVWTVSALAVAGVAMIGAVFALKGGLPGLSKAPPFIAAAVGPTKVQPPSDATVSTSSEAGASLLKDNTQADHVKVVNNEEQPVDLNAQTAQPPSPAPSAAANPAGGPVVRGMVDTPVVVMTPAPSPAPASPFPEPKPVRTISLRPDGTPIPASAAGAAAPETPPSQPVQEPPKPAAKATPDPAHAEASTPKIDLPTKLSAKSSARVVVAKTDTTAPSGAAEAPGEPVQLGRAAGKPEKPAKSKTQEAAAEPAAPAAAEPTEAASPGGWAVQLAAPRSEAEAKSVMEELKDKYASALGGKWLGVHKATVNGETIYRVRVTGLSKPDAAALCARLKGDGGQCFVAK